MKTAGKLPRLARLVKSYLKIIHAPEIPFLEKTKLKGARLKQIEREVERLERRRAGFTLVEMLVAVALVIIMMTLFATIFQMATGAMQKQKGLSENDQRVRLV